MNTPWRTIIWQQFGAAIDDLDNANAEQVAAQYSKMKDLVEYAEPNFKIELDPTEEARTVNAVNSLSEDSNIPNDPMFNEQWALSNTGQNGGKEKADIPEAKHGGEAAELPEQVDRT